MGKYYLLLVSGISILCFLTQITALQAQTPIKVKSQKLEVKNRELGVRSQESGAIFLPQPPQFSFPTPQVWQLSDVQPDDWASRALQSLIWRYGIITGYPNGKFLGDRTLSRYEFAAALGSVLRQLERSLSHGQVQVTEDDLAAIARLQQEYTAELANLQSRLDSLEARSAELQSNEFSTTTKLTGRVILAINGGGFGGSSLLDPTGTEIANDNPVVTLLYQTELDFDTSFSGTDLLKIRLDTGSNGSRDNTAGVLEPNFGSGLDFSLRPSRSRIRAALL
jgi:Carbohydrate-selective porin, OprB family/S-layer homology domain